MIPTEICSQTRNWFDTLMTQGFCNQVHHQGKFVHAIKTPSLFHVRPKVMETLRKNYTADRETGGILLARPIKANGKSYFDIYDVIFLPNILPKEKQESSYWFNEHDLQRALAECFRYGKEEDKRISFPIFFHTHPTCDPDNVNRMLKYFAQTRTSLSDQGLAHTMARSYKGSNFVMPNALVVVNPKLQGQFFIGFFGGYIAPESFCAYMEKVTGKTFQSICDDIAVWVGNDETKQIVLVTATAILLGIGIYYAEDVIPLLLMLYALNIIPLTVTYFEETPNYFSQVFDCEKPLSIHIPEFDS